MYNGSRIMAKVNRNIPLRGLLYVTDLYRGYLEQQGLSVHQSQQIHLPCPHFIVFYNGVQNAEDRFTMKLTEAFSETKEQDESCLEFTVTFININLGHNQEILEKCQRLNEYSLFIAKIREKVNEGMSFNAAAEKAVDECIQEDILADFLRKIAGRCRTQCGMNLMKKNLLRMRKNMADKKADEKAEKKAFELPCYCARSLM